jgi:type II secretory pathway component GspD/PulD (secretin)
LPLRHLTPQQARLLFPDFLLPILRADLEHNALIVTGTPELVARIRRDLAVLDQPRAQVRVEATVWELSSQNDVDFALRAARAHGRWRETLDTATGEISVGIAPEQRRSLTVTIEALAANRRARLVARPFVVVTSGERGTLFSGQSRFVRVIKQRGDQQDAEAIELQIGYSLSVRPVVGAAEFVTLELNPRVSTVDALEDFTRLPTLGIREANMVARVRPDDAVLVAGLDSELDFSTQGRTLLPASRRRDRAQTHLIILVTARRI